MMHRFEFRVYHEDVDLAGIVYYANYLKFAERARTETMRDLGFDLQVLKAREGVEFAVRRCNVDYISPAFIDDLLGIHTEATKVGGASFELRQTVKRGDETLVVLDVKLACRKSDGRPGRLPVEIRDALKKLIVKESGD